MSTIILIAVAYILGSVPNALWIGKVFKEIDIREHGSKNTGSTNAARVLGAKLGILTLILDISKGAIPVALSLFMKADLLENIKKDTDMDIVVVNDGSSDACKDIFSKAKELAKVLEQLLLDLNLESGWNE